MFTITSNPEHDADMYDIECSHIDNIDRYPLCEICGEPILPGESYFEDIGGGYYHSDCIIFKEMDER